MSDPIVYDLEGALSALDSGTEPASESSTTEGAASAVATPASSDDPRLEAMREALRISEGARQDLMTRMGQTAQAQPEQPKWFSPAEIRDMLNSDDPDTRYQAVVISQNQALAQAAGHFEQRLGMLTAGTLDAAKAEAKRLYPVEFELFGDQIEQYASNLPDKSQLANTQGWGHIVRFVRGDDSNFERLSEARAARKAREVQTTNVPNSFTPTRGASQGFVLDDATREIARTLVDAGIYKSIDDYAKDMRGLNNLSF